MKRTTKLKLIFTALILFILILTGYKVYLVVFESTFDSENLKNIKAAQDALSNTDRFTFIVVGNIENSIGIFDKILVDRINREKPDLVISAGNAVADGAEDKYRILHKSLKKIQAPSVVCVGEDEVSGSGRSRFYDHFGPYYFSFEAGSSYFIFLDTTEDTTELWQRDWLVKTLEDAQSYACRFVVMNKPPYRIRGSTLMEKIEESPLIDELRETRLIPFDHDYIRDDSYRRFLLETFSHYKVNAVFCSSLKIFDHRELDGVSYFVTGGGGGSLLMNNDASYYHYLKVTVGPEGMEYQVVKDVDRVRGAPGVFLENLWIRVHSFFYVSLVNFLLVVSFFFGLCVLVYARLTRKVDFYPDFGARLREPDKKLRIAMFTNTFSPFVGGVPISIRRLADGLRNSGHTVFIFAPEYPGGHAGDDAFTIRCRRLIQYREFAVANIFSREIREKFDALGIDLVHVHHPFWMGTKGRRLAARKHIPVVFTYHTRLEKYAHNIPLIGGLFRNILPHYLIRRFAQRCDAIIAPTSTAREYLRNLGVGRRIVVLPTGVDLLLYERVDAEKLRRINEQYHNGRNLLLISVSRLTREKNLSFLLQGIARVKERSEMPFNVVLIGDGPEKNAVISQVERLGLKDTVHLAGSRSQEELCAYYRAADLFIFASLSETQGMVLLEAMAGKTPVVAVRSSGIQDVIRDGYNGYKTDADIGEWVDRVLLLMMDQALRERMSLNACSFAGKFSTSRIAAGVVRLYGKVLQESPARD